MGQGPHAPEEAGVGAPAGAAKPPETRRHAVFHSLAVSEIERLTCDAVAITFDVPPELAEEYRFACGQHVTLRCELAGDDVRRNYSICSPAPAGRLRVGVKRLPGGVFSGFALEKLRVGDRLEVMTPSGRFTLPVDPANAKHYCAIAAGSGITPILSILATVLAAEPESRFTLLYGNRTTGSIMFLEELEDQKDRHLGRFQLIHVLSRERQDAELLNGRLDGPKLERLLGVLVAPATVDEWLLCGPAEMLDSARMVLEEHGVDPSRVHRELFHLGPAPPPRSGGAAPVATSTGESDVTILLDGRASSFRLAPEGGTILDAALTVRGDAPYACRNGMCGTCRARVVEGEVQMERNYALESDELAAGFVLACQSHPASGTVVLDFDA